MRELDQLTTMLEEQITFFSNEANKHKSLYRSCRYAVASLSALSAVLAALSFILPQDYVSLAIILVSAISGVISFREGLRKPYELWLNERATCHQLLDLQRDIRFYLNEHSSLDQITVFYQRLQAIVIGSGKNWRQLLSATNDSKLQQNSEQIT